uniref:Ig-like domain-containing protein n=1 Tax=Amphimedon queenslandica TaxID=400682 RepID=A0A1X7VX19_AMPQE
MTGLISSASSVNNKDYDLAVFESRLFTTAVIAGLNASDDPIRTISCSFVSLTAQHIGNQSLDRIECNVREYPPNEQLMLNVAQRIFKTINLLVSEDFQQFHFSEFGFCNESYTTSSIYGNYTWPEVALTSSRTSSSVSHSCNFHCGSVTRICRVTGWDIPDYSQCGVSAGTFLIYDIHESELVRDSYTINQGYAFGLICGLFCSSSPTGEEFKWFDSNGNEGLYSQQYIEDTFEFESMDVAYLISYIDFDREGDFILPDTYISGSYTCRSSSGNYSQTVSVNTRNPNGPFSQFFFRFTTFFTNISLTDVEDKDYTLEVFEANIFYEADVVDGFNSTTNPIRTIYCHFVPLMEEDVTGDRVECDVREYPPNSSFVAVVWHNISTFISDTDNNAFQSIVMSVTGFCNQSQTESLDFGVHTWSESFGNTILTLPCGNRPMMNVTRMCQTTGVGWENPDYSQCETSEKITY